MLTYYICILFDISNFYIRFPRDPKRRKRWNYLMRRKGWTANKWDKVCSAHFREEDFDKTGQTVRLREGVEPSIFSPPFHTQVSIIVDK